MIKNIQLKGFRLFEEINLETNNSLVILCGDNATGKTSILEAIYLCSTTKSHRTTNIDALIKNKADFALALIDEKNKYKVVVSKKEKNYFINNQQINKAGEFIGNLSVVLSSPLDIYLINGSKAEKRRFLDLEISLLDKKYLNNLSRYKRILNERNNILKQDSIDKIMLNIITDELVKATGDIYKRRVEFVDKINEFLEKISNELNVENIKIKYIPTYDNDIKKSFDQKEKLDILTQVTNIGTHRDDFKIYINKQTAEEYASEGQSRTICIAIKMAIKMYKEYITGIEPILLLDDVFAALDTNRIERLTKYVKSSKQTFITTTSINEIPKDLIKDSLIVEIDSKKGE